MKVVLADVEVVALQRVEQELQSVGNPLPRIERGSRITYQLILDLARKPK